MRVELHTRVEYNGENRVTGRFVDSIGNKGEKSTILIFRVPAGPAVAGMKRGPSGIFSELFQMMEWLSLGFRNIRAAFATSRALPGSTRIPAAGPLIFILFWTLRLLRQ